MVLHPVKQFQFNREMQRPKSLGLKISNRGFKHLCGSYFREVRSFFFFFFFFLIFVFLLIFA
jgi:hypothetical protein